MSEQDKTSEATTTPLTVDDLHVAIWEMENEPMQPDRYLDSPAMRRAIGVEEDTRCRKSFDDCDCSNCAVAALNVEEDS